MGYTYGDLTRDFGRQDSFYEKLQGYKCNNTSTSGEECWRDTLSALKCVSVLIMWTGLGSYVSWNEPSSNLCLVKRRGRARWCSG